MGYFSNGSEGSDYEERWCSSCVHNVETGCAVWLAHLLHNGESGPAPVLEILIPRSEDRLSNLKCRMHITNEQVNRARHDKRQLKLFNNLVHVGRPEPVNTPIYVAAEAS